MKSLYKSMVCSVCGKEKETWHSSKGRYCSSACQNTERYNNYILKWKMGEVSGNKGIGYGAVSNHVRRYIFDKYGHRCSVCGWSEINKFTKTIPLEIDHIDGNSENSSERNLRLLCPNCHSLTENHSTGKKNGRRYYRNLYNKMGSSGDG